MFDPLNLIITIYLLIAGFLFLSFLGDREVTEYALDSIPESWPQPVFGLVMFLALAIAALIWPVQMIKIVLRKYRKYLAKKRMSKMLELWNMRTDFWPAYQCHKRVRAMKISRIEPKDNPDVTGNSAAESYGAFIFPVEKQCGTLSVDDSFMTKHHPQVGGYIVVYDDGYMSYSPAKAFEEGYTEITPGCSPKYETEQDRSNRHLAEVAAAMANVGDAKKSE
jgi:hypothetical protein